jgi:hypothetical protein
MEIGCNPFCFIVLSCMRVMHLANISIIFSSLSLIVSLSPHVHHKTDIFIVSMVQTILQSTNQYQMEFHLHGDWMQSVRIMHQPIFPSSFPLSLLLFPLISCVHHQTDISTASIEQTILQRTNQYCHLCHHHFHLEILTASSHVLYDRRVLCVGTNQSS